MFLFIRIDTTQSLDKRRLSIDDDNGYFRAHSGNRAIVARLRQRQAHPGTYCRQLDEHTIQLGYGPAGAWQFDDEYLSVVITDKGDIRLQRDIYCTLPLYYAYQQGRLIISNLYSAVTAELAVLTPDIGVVNARLAGRTSLGPRTLYAEIATIEERDTLTISQGVLRHVPGKERPESRSLDAPPTDPHHFLPTLDAAFERLIHGRLAGGNVAFEISGGLDSGTLPLYIAKTYPGSSLPGVAMRYAGDHRLTQEPKLQALRSAATMEIVEQDLQTGRNSPLQRMMQEGRFVAQALPSPMETYQEPTDFFARLLHERGVDTVVTGIGGDELFEHIVDLPTHLRFGNEAYKEYARNAPPYVTTAHQEAVQRALTSLQVRLPLLSTVLHSASVYRNNTYIEHDIWPVSQFSDPYLVRFCQGLPAHFKANKNILRAFYQAHNFPPQLYNSSQNEDFDSFFEASFYDRTFDTHVESLLPQAYTVRQGYVDAEQLRLTYEAAIQSRDSTWLYCLYCWMCTEIDMAYHRQKVSFHVG